MCGTKFMENAKFCMNCGLSVAEYEKKLEQLKNSESPSVPKSISTPKLQPTSIPKSQTQLTPEKLYELGTIAEGKKDYTNAIKYYIDAIKAGNTDAIIRIGDMQFSGQGMKKDTQKALEWYLKAANAGNKKGMGKVANFYLSISNDYAKAFEWATKGANLNDAQSLEILSYIYMDENPVVKMDYKKSFELIRKSADLGYSKAICELGFRYSVGDFGTSKDINKAIELYKKAANLGDLNAMYYLGLLYYQGEDVPQDKKQAFMWFEKASKIDNFYRLKKLAEKYVKGNIDEKNVHNAIELYEKAVELGDTESIEILKKLKSTISEIPNASSSTSMQNKTENNVDLESYIIALKQIYGNLTKVYFKGQGDKAKQKISAAIASYAHDFYDETAIFVFDDTLFGSAKDGFLVTNKTIYIHNQFDDKEYVMPLPKIKSFSLKKGSSQELWINEEIKIILKGYDLEASSLLSLMNDILQTLNSTNKNDDLLQGQSSSLSKSNPSTTLPLNSSPIKTQDNPNNDADKLFELGWAAQKKENYADALKYYKKALEAGNIKAMAWIAYLYENGYGVPKNTDKAMELYKKAASLGNPMAMCEIGQMYNYGIGVQENKAEAFKWHMKAAKLDHVKSINLIVNMYDNGEGIAKNEKEAAAWKLKAAKLGSSYDMYEMSLRYEQGKGVPVDNNKAFEWALKAAEAGNAVAAGRIGEKYYEQKNYNESFKWFMNSYQKRPEIINHSEDHLYMIGDMYFKGLGTSQNRQKAFEWFLKSAERGYAMAMLMVAAMYSEGKDIPQDKQSALKWYKEVIENADNKELINMAQMQIANMQKTAIPTSIDLDKLLYFLINNFSMDCVYFVGQGNKAENKINNALRAYGMFLRSGERAFGCFDNTFFGGADDGCLFTDNGIHIHNPNDDKVNFVFYADIRSINLKGIITKDIYINDIKIDLDMLNGVEGGKAKFCDLIRFLYEAFTR